MKDKSKILQSTGKRKRALPEGNSPGISCSTGLVKERKGIANLSFYRPNQEQNALKKLIFILLIGPKNGGAYNDMLCLKAHSINQNAQAGALIIPFRI
jgi:hypothetical protein